MKLGASSLSLTLTGMQVRHICGRHIEIQYRFLLHFQFGRYACPHKTDVRLVVLGFPEVLQHKLVATVTPFSVL